MTGLEDHKVRDAHVRVFPADPNEGDRSDMYVLDALGLNIVVYVRAAGTYVHVEDNGIAPENKPLLVEINNGGEAVIGGDR